MLSILSPKELQVDLAKKLKSKRKWLKHSRADAARLSGVPEPTIRRFENTGEISLRQFFMLCNTYGDLSIYKESFPEPVARTMDELIKLNQRRENL